MRRNRLKVVRVADAEIQSSVGWRVTAPGVYRRLLAVTANVASATLGVTEPINCRFAVRDGNADIPVAETISAEVGGAPSDGVVSFTLGGVVAGGLNTDQRITGPLPDVWWGPDIVINLHLTQPTGGPSCFSGCVVLLEECDLSEG